jgi:hypothetical protein
VKKQGLRVGTLVSRLRKIFSTLGTVATKIRIMLWLMSIFPLTSQSEVGTAITGKHEITTFHDLDPGYGVSPGGENDETFDTVAVEDSGLGAFLARPVRIYEAGWGTGATSGINTTFNPWNLFFTNPAVLNKINNFNNLKCKLHVKFVINGNSFLYGRLLCAYEPMHQQNQLSIGGLVAKSLIPLSQRPHILLNPTTNEGGSMELPFVWYNNYLNIPRQQWNEMGEISISSLNELRHATGERGSTDVTVYAWVSDLVLTTPTALPSQSKSMGKKKPKKTVSFNTKDEYGTGIVSKPASAVAAAAGWLKNMPVVGPYARATQMIATSVGETARLFGYSRPTDVCPTTYTKLISANSYANVDKGDTPMKLSLDSKCEVTIDPRVMGAEGGDHQGIYDLVQRQSLLTTATWETEPLGGTVGTSLFVANVTPSICGTTTAGTVIYNTPMSWMSQLFGHWHGSIIYRFQVVASNFHKGRLLLTYDPNQFTSTEENIVYTEVIDISLNRDFEVEIGWGSSLPFLRIRQCGADLGGIQEEFRTDDIALPFNALFCNGQLNLSILNELTSPGDNTVAPAIDINVYVKGSDDLKFAVPNADFIRNLSIRPLNSQSEVVGVDALTDKGNMENSPEETLAMSLNTENSNAVDHLTEVFFGEHIVSLKDLFRRYCFHAPWFLAGHDDNNEHFMYLKDKVFPWYRATMPPGTPGIMQYNDVFTDTYHVSPAITTPLTYCAPSFIGWRGAMRKKLIWNMKNDNQSAIVSCTRYPKDNFTPAARYENYDNEIEFLASGNSYIDSYNGAEYTYTRNTGTLEVEFPYYSEKRFSSPRIYLPAEIQSETYEYCVNTSYSGGTAGDQGILKEFISTGEDFTLMFFINVPIMYKLNFPALP